MHVVVIHGFGEASEDLTRSVAVAWGSTPFEVRQRMVGGGPAVLASFAEPGRAKELAGKLQRCGVAALVVDCEGQRRQGARFAVRRFELGTSSLRLEAVDGESVEIGYREVALLLPGTKICGQSELKTVTERKLSLGRTLLSGGIPLTKTVTRQEEVATEERTRVLYLFAGRHPQLLFRQSGMSYDGFGAAMKMSQEMNFSFLISELRRLAPGASYDDRLASRSGQVRLLGPTQNPETGLDLAAEILGRILAGWNG